MTRAMMRVVMDKRIPVMTTVMEIRWMQMMTRKRFSK